MDTHALHWMHNPPAAMCMTWQQLTQCITQPHTQCMHAQQAHTPPPHSLITTLLLMRCRSKSRSGH